MEITLLTYFFIAIATTIAGSLPLGPVNLSVVSITVNKSRRKAMEFSMSAAIVEILIAVSAIYFGKCIEQFFETNSWIQIFIFSVFIGLGIYNLIRKANPQLKNNNTLQVSEFVRGAFISLINPQVIIFWVFVLTFITQEFETMFTPLNLIVFLLGVFITKLVVLFSFSKLSYFLKDKLKASSSPINKTMGIVLLIIGLVQAYRFFY